MTEERSFYLSDDPRPEESGDPDDPRPEESGDPDDPRPEESGDPDDPRPEESGDPDDPRPEESGDPDDPRPEESGDPDDPRPEESGDPDDPRPEESGDPDDPEVRDALELLESRLAGEPCRRRRPPRCRPARRRKRRAFPYQYSGKIVIRLSGHLVSEGDDDATLEGVAKRLGLTGLERVLERHDLAGHRLVDLTEDGVVDPARGCRCKRPPCSCGKCPTVHDLERRARTTALPPLHSLASYWRVDVSEVPIRTRPRKGERWHNGWEPSHERTVRRILADLNELVEVDRAYRELAVMDPAPPDGNTFSSVQAYLDETPVGINARWARAQLTGSEAPVGLVDLEQGWIPHEDLEPPNVDLNEIFGNNRDGEGLYRGHHGTAVLGQIVGADNDRGVLGIASAARVRVVSHYNQDERKSRNVANAIRQAIPKMEPGDVLLLEVQRSYLPTEVDDADRDAIRLAVAHGIIVVEAAGNGNADLDRFVDERGERVLNRRARGYRDSGAIMVGAARAARPHNRLAGRVGVGSNSGSRVDCFAHGNAVVTAGYGDLDAYLEGDPDRPAYTHTFGGTSSAAPIIAGAALLVQAIHQGRTGTRVSPWEMRNLLSDPATGTRQGRRVRGRIGIMPDLRKVLRRRLGLVSDLYLRDRPGDSGAPGGFRASASPDIAILAEGAPMPPADGDYVGEGACKPGEKYRVCARLRNRGHDEAEGQVRFFWSEVATLLTPSMWNPLDPAEPGLLTAPKTVPVGDAPVWSQPVAWAPSHAALSEGARHQCWMAVVEEPRKPDGGVPDPALPSGFPPYFDWRQFRAFLRSHKNVACRNLHLVDVENDVGDDGAFELSFALTGAPDFARRFDFEIVRRLPGAARVRLKAPTALAARFARRRLWSSKILSPKEARLEVPSLPRVRVEGVRLLAGARFDCSFRISGDEIRDGHSLAIRQLHRGAEVGRITWRFRKGSS